MNRIRQIILLTVTLTLTGFAGQARDILFRPLLQKELRRLKTQQPGGLQKLAARTHESKREVFIDLARLYWGSVEELTDLEEGGDTDLNQIAVDLRTDLKAFARQFGFKLCWQNQGNNELPDMTQKFLEYWDHVEQDNLITVSQETR